jgi:WD40 repeat protein
MNNNCALNPKRKNDGLKSFRDEEPEKRSLLKHDYKPACLHHGVRSVNLTHDNRYLIITYMSNHGYIRVIDLEKLELLPYRYLGHTDSVRMVSVSKNNQYFYTVMLL